MILKGYSPGRGSLILEGSHRTRRGEGGRSIGRECHLQKGRAKLNQTMPTQKARLTVIQHLSQLSN